MNLVEISIRISSPLCEVELEVGAGDVHVLRHLGAQPEVHPLQVRVPEGDVGEAVEVEVGAELAVEHAQGVADELAR